MPPGPLTTLLWPWVPLKTESRSFPGSPKDGHRKPGPRRPTSAIPSTPRPVTLPVAQGGPSLGRPPTALDLGAKHEQKKKWRVLATPQPRAPRSGRGVRAGWSVLLSAGSLSTASVTGGPLSPNIRSGNSIDEPFIRFQMCPVGSVVMTSPATPLRPVLVQSPVCGHSPPLVTSGLLSRLPF